ncbi:MAG: alanine racemase [Fusobacteria bacterium]|nr:alanine racemase [Fusobacteriota bacterium]
MRPVWAEVDLDLIENNSKAIKSFVGPQVMVMAIVKANGYGHGAVPLSLKIEDTIDMFGVAILEEALQLREAGVNRPILVLGYTSFEDYPFLLERNIIQTIYDYKQGVELNKVARLAGVRAKVHIKIDTGMNRLGFKDNEDTLEIIKLIENFEHLEIEGIFSHIANGGSEDISYSYKQLERFKNFSIKVEKSLGRKLIKHLANSATIVEIKESHLDMVRPGLMLYGSFSTDHENRQQIPLKKILTLKGIITQVKIVDEGEPVSYNGTFVTSRATRVGVLPLGYADGFARNLSNKGEVLVKGVKAPIIGNICMDQLMLDLTDLDEVKVGDEVVIYGEDNPAEYFAQLLDTISYEIYCNISERIPRIYLNE